MAPKQRYEGLIEAWPERAQLFIRELPGFFWAAPSREELIDASLDALDQHLAWLDGHGYPPPLEHDAGLAAIEDLPAKGDIGPRFDSDLLTIETDAVERALAIGRIALSDFIGLADALSDDEARAREIAPMALHLAVQEIWFATRMIERAPSLRPSADPIETLVAAAGLVEERVDEIAAGDRDEIVERDGEEWTLAKLLRRRTAHLREHALELAALTEGD